MHPPFQLELGGQRVVLAIATVPDITSFFTLLRAYAKQAAGNDVFVT